MNDSDDDISISSATSKHGINLIDEDGKLKKPQTKKQRSANIASSITFLTEKQENSVNSLADVLKNFANASSNNVDEKISSIESKVNGIEDKIDAMMSLMSRFK